MTNEQKQVKDWMLAFGQECPDKPTIPSLEVRKLRAKLHLEECLESIAALGVRIYGKDEVSGKEFEVTSGYFHCITIEEWEEPNLELIADGCEDLKVVTEGTLVACGLIKQSEYEKKTNQCLINDPLFDEVMRSNWTKLWTTEEVNKRGVITDDNSEAFDPTAICATNTLCDDEGWTYKALGKGPDNKWLVKDKDGKVIKSPSYSPPNLQPIVDSLRENKF